MPLLRENSVRFEMRTTDRGHITKALFFLCRLCKKEIWEWDFPCLLSKRTGYCRSCFPKSRFPSSPLEKLFSQLVYNARVKDIPVVLSLEEFTEFSCSSNCHYCHSLISWDPVVGRTNLDRKDNALGYTKDNCVVCCKTCNYAKGNRYSFEEWEIMTAALRKFRRNKL